jgi:serine/threonine protein kinase
MMKNAQAVGGEVKEAVEVNNGIKHHGSLLGGRYELHEVVGTGIQGSVRAATDVQTGEIVAIKLILKEPFVRRWSLSAAGRAHLRTQASLSVADEHESSFSLKQMDKSHPAMEPIAREVAVLENLRGHPNVVELKNVLWHAMLHHEHEPQQRIRDANNGCSVTPTTSNMTTIDMNCSNKYMTDNSTILYQSSVFRNARQATASTAASRSSCNECSTTQSDRGPGSSSSVDDSGTDKQQPLERQQHARTKTKGTAIVAVVMELCGAGELFDLMFYGGALCEDLAYPLLAQLLSALHYLHRLGVCHRDVSVVTLYKCQVVNQPALRVS